MGLSHETLLGQTTVYADEYNPAVLQPIPRQLGRDAVGFDGTQTLPFLGVDLWTHYEVSWLSTSGKPCVAIAELLVPADSPAIIESKSLKLYFNGLNFKVFNDELALIAQVEQDLSVVAGAPVRMSLLSIDQPWQAMPLPGRLLDHLNISTDIYDIDASLLQTNEQVVAQYTWYSHLLRSNCPVTNQPDWGSVMIRYSGREIVPESLLAYLISYRRHNDFHEQCVERIFMDLIRHCGCQQLTVYARYTRRGGLDINPFRSNFEQFDQVWRTLRQ
ncbi:MAG: NADPH-dependent 7-cyano-7-deazaguanine reductase QueF [Moraxellaceae bacterium]|nr:NADPH-dependent 7-cyano-7-deazaguanine reductase QueF [Moraxellaceae bacterium]MDZ4387127.1 NADPH-dependent 7-cyano-7-deazaguanine reductase QueF [Moraxellaceae bacterium]